MPPTRSSLCRQVYPCSGRRYPGICHAGAPLGKALAVLVPAYVGFGDQNDKKTIYVSIDPYPIDSFRHFARNMHWALLLLCSSNANRAQCMQGTKFVHNLSIEAPGQDYQIRKVQGKSWRKTITLKAQKLGDKTMRYDYEVPEHRSLRQKLGYVTLVICCDVQIFV